MTEQEQIAVIQKVASKEARKLIRKLCHLQKKALSEGLISTLESLLSIAVPIASISGEWELTTLLSSLRVYLDKKRLELQQADLEQKRIQEQSWSDLQTTYSAW